MSQPRGRSTPANSTPANNPPAKNTPAKRAPATATPTKRTASKAAKSNPKPSPARSGAATKAAKSNGAKTARAATESSENGRTEQLRRNRPVEVKIGVQHAHRELTLESPLTPAEVAAAVAKALENPDGLLTLVDEKGRQVIVPVGKVAYVEIDEATQRRVGFTAA